MDLITIILILVAVVLLIMVAVAGFTAYKKGVATGIEQRRQQAEAIVGSAEQQAERIIEDAEKDAENKKKSALIEAKDEIHKLRSDADKEIKDRRADHRAWRCKIRYDRRTILLRKNHIFSSPVNPAGGSRDETASDRGG